MPWSDEPPIEHFNYDVMDVDCRCRLCDDYRQAKQTYEGTKRERSRHSRFCRCEHCIGHRDRLVDFLAASNRRETYSELSFILASGPVPHRQARECLRWFYGLATDADYNTRTWWALNSPQCTLSKWMELFEAATLAVSGAA